MITAWTILWPNSVPDRSVFRSPKHAASWAGLCPGNHESGGKRLSNRTRKGNRWLRRALRSGCMGGNAQEELLPRGAFFYRKAGKHTGSARLLWQPLIACLSSPSASSGDGTEDQQIASWAATISRSVTSRADPQAASSVRLQRLGLDVFLQPPRYSPRRSDDRGMLLRLHNAAEVGPCLCSQRQIPSFHNGLRN